MAKKTHPTISEQVRNRANREIAGNRTTAYRLAKDSGISTSQVYKFLAGESDLSGTRLTYLARVLGIAVIRILTKGEGQ